MAGWAGPDNGLGNLLKQIYFDTPAPQVLSAPPQTVRGRIQDGLASVMEKVGYTPRHAQSFAGKATGFVNDVTPVGSAISADDAKTDFQQGNYAGATGNGLLSLLGLIPDGGALTGKGLGALHAIIAPLWHGSPHAFEKFALDRIGTGEGAQAYGHGLYFAENPEVAKEYQRQTAGDGFLTGAGQVFDPSTLGHMNVRSTLNRTGSLDDAIAKASDLLPSANAQTRPLLVQDLSTLTRLRENGGISRNTGHLYQVKLDANPEDFLDWDAPLDRQPDNILQRLPYANQMPNKTGGDYVRYGLGNSHNAYLQDKGIQGIRYLDQGSRGAGNGTSNYVVFDPSIIDILGRQ